MSVSKGLQRNDDPFRDHRRFGTMEKDIKVASQFGPARRENERTRRYSFSVMHFRPRALKSFPLNGAKRERETPWLMAFTENLSCNARENPAIFGDTIRNILFI